MLWRKKQKTVGWRNKDGEIECTGLCKNECGTECPIWWNTTGLKQLQWKQFDEAIKCFKAALDIAPDFSDAHNNLGTAYGHKGCDKEAHVCFLTANSLKPNSPPTLRGLVISEMKLGMYQEALHHCEELEARSAGNMQFLKEQILERMKAD